VPHGASAPACRREIANQHQSYALVLIGDFTAAGGRGRAVRH